MKKIIIKYNLLEQPVLLSQKKGSAGEFTKKLFIFYNSTYSLGHEGHCVTFPSHHLVKRFLLFHQNYQIIFVFLVLYIA